MKRAVFLYSVIFVCVGTAGIAFGQSDARPDPKTFCPFSITGMWQSGATTVTNPVFFSFSSDGWVRLLGHSADALPQDFEIMAEVKYKLDNPLRPKRLELIAIAGNQLFPKGTTSLEIIEYSDDSFTTRNPESGERTQWSRAQTHRYFLTFAAGTAPSYGLAFAMWTALDGRKTEVEALGVQLHIDDAGTRVPIFARIPTELYSKLREESGKARKGSAHEDAVMRLELTESEFERTHKIFVVWDKYVKTHSLPYKDPYLNGMEFLTKSADSLNQCGERVKLPRVSPHEREETLSKHNLPRYLFQYIRVMRESNNDLHVTDKAVPWGWRPILQLPKN